MGMTRIVRTNSKHPDFIKLVKLLDADLAISDGDEHAFYDQFNKLDDIKHTIVLYLDNKPISCGAIKELTSDTMEVKRMYTLPKQRNKGYATLVLNELEKWTSELAYGKCILETGKKQPEAISLYKKNGYRQITNYGQYANIENSVCFQKEMFKS